jgi:hypothetical protein
MRSLVAASLILTAAGTANAALVTLNAVQDTFIVDRPSNSGQRDSTNDGQLLTNWNNGSNNSSSGRRREVIFQFDLSGISPSDTIASAYLSYYDTGAGGPNGPTDQNSPFVNDTYFVTRRAGLTDAEVEVLTYNAYATGAVGGGGSSKWLEIATPSLNLSLAANNATSQYHNTGLADLAALNSLNTLKNDYGYLMVLSWLPASGQFRTFGDLESGNPPQLVLDVVPEPSSYVLAGIALIGLMVAQRTGVRRSRAAVQLA